MRRYTWSGSGLPLNTPSVRSRGRVGNPFESVCFWVPSPFAVAPWQGAQPFANSSRPRTCAAAS